MSAESADPMPQPEPPGLLHRARSWAAQRILGVRKIQVVREFRVPPVEDFPLRLYDVLYESGKFPAIYRVLGDLVLEAPLGPASSHPPTLRLEALVPTSEEEVALVPEPKLRVIVTGALRQRKLGREGRGLLEALETASQLLTSHFDLTALHAGLDTIFPISDWPEAYAVAARAKDRKLAMEGSTYEVRLSLEGTALRGPVSEAPFRWAAALTAARMERS